MGHKIYGCGGRKYTVLELNIYSPQITGILDLNKRNIYRLNVSPNLKLGLWLLPN